MMSNSPVRFATRFLASCFVAGLLALGASPSAGGAELRLLSLTCEEINDPLPERSDEPYLEAESDAEKVNNPVWLAKSMSEGQTRDLRNVELIKFTRTLKLKLYDDDPKDDDLLGEVVVEAKEANKGVRTAYFKEKGARYTLKFEVVP